MLGLCAGVAARVAMGAPATAPASRPTTGRTFHLSVSEDALDAEPELLTLVREAGVTDVWLTGFLYGHWYFSPERISKWRDLARAQGLGVHVCNVPLGHPGDSLGAADGKLPLSPPAHWKTGGRIDGTRYTGTSLHAPATQENAESLRRIRSLGITDVFLDDDFRLAISPGAIGGCFCDEHRQAFLKSHGYGQEKWTALLEAVHGRRLTPLLREWVSFTCDELTGSFRAQQAAVPGLRLGIMVMYLGAEKAGIRLADYRDVPMRVGEMMFDDGSFSSVKNKTAELFSALFHRRFVRPELAYSETTAYPADRLSARNMAAKLAVSTISDVRNTMFMSGRWAFPRDHWQTLAPAMKRHANIHRRLAGHTPRGPLKHYWGEHERFVGDDNPHSLFLALGVPFEVTAEPAGDGWTFLADHDARAVAAGKLTSSGTRFICRPTAGGKSDGMQAVAESLSDLFAFKRLIVPRLAGVPFVEDDKPVVCSWYPTGGGVLLWNLSERQETFSLRSGQTRRSVAVNGLDVEFIPVT